MKFFILFLIWNCGSTIEFIPDSDFTDVYPDYKLKKKEEVEILFKKPNERIITYGRILVRDFSNDSKAESAEHELRAKLFEWKMDGIWFDRLEKFESASPIIFQTKSEHGMPTSYSQTSGEMTRLTGYPFRYRNYARKR
ncbi:MAG: hypothetical protein SFU98_03050 [Leptospiraceae bacterium]|nr:hypothetical protein [Leptospiraceae bacterium]